MVASIDLRLREAVESRGLPPALRDGVLYAVLGPGKRVRPVLVLRSCAAISDTGFEDALTAGAALEMIHAFSLVHDDLPAMDDDDLRRGRPTLHKHADEATAILAGDVLQSLASELLSRDIDDPALSRSVVTELSVATTDMIAGQVYDTLAGFPDGVPELEQLTTIHRLKTGALLRAAARMGGRCGGASDDQLAALTYYADAIGLMFQAVDDLLDVTSDAATLGKATQKDADAGKLTYPGVLGVDGTREQIGRLRTEALEALSGFGESADPLRTMAERLATRTR